ncbi:MAG: diadenylate cyclase CdaA [Bdellovibrionota bacterium]
MWEIFNQFNWWSVLDIAVLSYIIYQVLLLIRGTRAAQMLTGVLVVIAAFLLSSIVPLTALNWMMNKFYSSFIIILIILFQDDIRLALSRIGKRSFIANTENASSSRILDEITKSAIDLATNSIGALIVFERSILLNRYIDFGSILDAKISRDILMAIFHTSSPIHDGAVIIQNGRIAAAGCFLPLTRDEHLDPNMGTRHRAAIGVSQETDALVVLVSEENAAVSIAIDGKFLRHLDSKSLRKALQKYLVDEQEYARVTEQPTKKEPRNWFKRSKQLSSGDKT